MSSTLKRKRKPMFYTLDENNQPVPCEAKDMAVGRRVAYWSEGEIVVSTVFLGVDHNHLGDEPVLFETMTLVSGNDANYQRCGTWAEAEVIHAAEVLKYANGGLEDTSNAVVEASLYDIQNHYDWEEAFGEGSGGNTDQEVESHDGTDRSRVLRADVARVIASVNGENDEDSWIAVCKMKDGRYACIEGSCDYTGWDCQAGNCITVAKSLASLIQHGMTAEWCRRLGLKHPGLKEG